MRRILILTSLVGLTLSNANLNFAQDDDDLVTGHETTQADDRFSPGGTHVTYSNDKMLLRGECWYDSAGNEIVKHTVKRKGAETTEYWAFSTGKARVIMHAMFEYDQKTQTFRDSANTPSAKYTATPQEVREWMERISDQWAKDRTIPTDYRSGSKPPETGKKPPPLTAGIDPCVVGKWVATLVDDLGTYKFRGGTGFTVQIDPDGTQTVDYASMEPFVNLQESFKYEGRAVGKITAHSGSSSIVSISTAGVRQVATLVVTGAHSLLLKNMGPGALGSTANDNDYTCTESNLTYKTSWLPSGKPNYQVVLTRRK